MSRIGKLPIVIPQGVDVTIDKENNISVKGPKGVLNRKLVSDIKVQIENGVISVTRDSNLKKFRELHGLTRTLINNMVVGVTEGYSKILEINGVVYRAAKDGKKLNLTLGYSHPVVMIDPEGVVSTVEGNNKIIISGINKELVGQYAAEIRSKRPPEPYKGKGIKYSYEKIRRKDGKSGKSGKK